MFFYGYLGSFIVMNSFFYLIQIKETPMLSVCLYLHRWASWLCTVLLIICSETVSFQRISKVV